MGTITPPIPPAPQGVKWYKSQRVIALAQATTLLVLVWVGQGLTTHVWDLYSLGAVVVSNAIVILKDWWNPNIVAPLAMFNRSNRPGG
jgi:hypothetical protein